MKNDILNKLWNSEEHPSPLAQPEAIIKKAKLQRQRQYISIIVLAVSVVILGLYAGLYFPKNLNHFGLGLLLMMAPLVFRIILEWVSIYKKETKIMTMQSKAYHNYLKLYYSFRKVVKYGITPLCFGIYTYGVTLLFPYFKREFTSGVYIYLVATAIVSLIVIAGIIVRGIAKENQFYKAIVNK